MTSPTPGAVVADASILRLAPGTPERDLARAQAVLSVPPSGQIVVVADPFAATVQNPLAESGAGARNAGR